MDWSHTWTGATFLVTRDKWFVYLFYHLSSIVPYVYLQPMLTYWLLEIFSFDVYSGINCSYKLLYSCVESFNGDNSHQMTVSDWLRCRLALIMMCISVCVLIFPVSTCSKWKKSLLVSGVWWLLLTQLKPYFLVNLLLYCCWNE